MAVDDIRVLRIISGLDPRHGGPSESSVSACIASQRCGIANTFVFPESAGPTANTDHVCRRLLDQGVRVSTFPIMSVAGYYGHRWGLSPVLVAWIARHIYQYDVVHVHQTWGLVQVAGLLASVCASRPSVVSPHESLTDYDVGHTRPVAKRVLKLLYLSRASLIVLSSQMEMEDSVPTRYRARSTVIPHPLAEIQPRMNRPAKAEDRPLVVGFLGRLHEKKNVDVLIRAVAQMAGDTRLRIAGDGPVERRRALTKVVAEVGLTDRVEWLGFVSRYQRDAFLDSLDVLAMPSRYECFGMAAAEAMARGVATIVSPTTGIAGLVAEYGCGQVAPATSHGFARALQELDRDPQLIHDLGCRGIEAARAELSMESYGSRMRLEYERLLESGPRRDRCEGE